MNRYDQILKLAKEHLRDCKACSTCKNATETIDRDMLCVTYYCNVYNKDVTKHCELMCKNYAEK